VLIGGFLLMYRFASGSCASAPATDFVSA